MTSLFPDLFTFEIKFPIIFRFRFLFFLSSIINLQQFMNFIFAAPNLKSAGGIVKHCKFCFSLTAAACTITYIFVCTLFCKIKVDLMSSALTELEINFHSLIFNESSYAWPKFLYDIQCNSSNLHLTIPNCLSLYY